MCLRVWIHWHGRGARRRAAAHDLFAFLIRKNNVVRPIIPRPGGDPTQMRRKGKLVRAHGASAGRSGAPDDVLAVIARLPLTYVPGLAEPPAGDPLRLPIAPPAPQQSLF